MEDRQPTEYQLNNELIQGTYYIVKISDTKQIPFTYDIEGSQEKPFKLDNGIRLDHVPTASDKSILNLHPVNVDKEAYTEEEAKQISIKAGTNSQKSQVKRKTFAESINMVLSLKANQDQIRQLNPELLSRMTEEDKQQLTQEDIIVFKAVELAQLGSDKHQTFLRDTVGEKPTDRQELTADIMTDGDRQLLEKIQNRLNV